MRSKRNKPELVAEEVIKKNEDLEGFRVDIIPPKGRGVRTTVDRYKGDFLLTYHGELISGEEGDQRETKSDSVFRYFFNFKGKQWCIDSTLEVNNVQCLGRLVNHGVRKEQNCRMRCIQVGQKPYLCLFAVRDIPTGEELLYDYGVSNLPWETHNSEGVNEATFEDNHSPVTLQHGSEILQLQQASLDNHCADVKSKGSGPIPSQSMPIDPDLEIEPVSHNQGIRPLNPQDVDESIVEDIYSPESLQHSSGTLQLQQASQDDRSDLKSTGCSPIPCQSLTVDADLEMEPISPSQAVRPPIPQVINSEQVWGSVVVLNKHEDEELDIFLMESTVLAIGSARTNDIIVSGSAPHEVLLEINRFGEAFIVRQNAIPHCLKDGELFVVYNRTFKWSYPCKTGTHVYVKIYLSVKCSCPY